MAVFVQFRLWTWDLPNSVTWDCQIHLSQTAKIQCKRTRGHRSINSKSLRCSKSHLGAFHYIKSRTSDFSIGDAVLRSRATLREISSVASRTGPDVLSPSLFPASCVASTPRIKNVRSWSRSRISEAQSSPRRSDVYEFCSKIARTADCDISHRVEPLIGASGCI